MLPYLLLPQAPPRYFNTKIPSMFIMHFLRKISTNLTIIILEIILRVLTTTIKVPGFFFAYNPSLVHFCLGKLSLKNGKMTENHQSWSQKKQQSSLIAHPTNKATWRTQKDKKIPHNDVTDLSPFSLPHSKARQNYGDWKSRKIDIHTQKG